MRVAICDDEKIFLEQMEELLKGISDISQVDCYDDVSELERQLKNSRKYDLLFMDIEWKQPRENGTHFAAKINKEYPGIQTVFMTAYNERFSEAIFWEPVNLCGYLVKPVKYDNLRILLEKAKQNIDKQKSEKIVVQYRGITETILLLNIIYLESCAHQVFISTTTDKIAIYKKLDEYEKELQHSFVRIHKSYLVNMNYIKRIDRSELTLRDGTVLPVSKGKYQATKDKFFRFMGEQL
ncbi:MAG: LytR/AlgR family response regulator transcription factor [Lachnospiraceae bacterium]